MCIRDTNTRNLKQSLFITYEQAAVEKLPGFGACSQEVPLYWTPQKTYTSWLRDYRITEIPPKTAGELLHRCLHV